MCRPDHDPDPGIFKGNFYDCGIVVRMLHALQVFMVIYLNGIFKPR